MFYFTTKILLSYQFLKKEIDLILPLSEVLLQWFEELVSQENFPHNIQQRKTWDFLSRTSIIISSIIHTSFIPNIQVFYIDGLSLG